MLILDTNIISEMMRPVPHERAAAWIEAQPLDHLALTAVTVAELLYGLDRLPDGRRKDDLSGRLDAVLRRGFGGRVLPFDHAAAQTYGRLKGERERAGRPLVGYDAMIAAIAQTHGAGIVTRNVDDFEGCGVTIINPWVD
jgi:predicted nucleic acid-binding protein